MRLGSANNGYETRTVTPMLNVLGCEVALCRHDKANGLDLGEQWNGDMLLILKGQCALE